MSGCRCQSLGEPVISSSAAEARGVALTDSELFVPGREPSPHAVRVSLTATRTIDELRDGLGRLRDLLRVGPVPVLAVA